MSIHTLKQHKIDEQAHVATLSNMELYTELLQSSSSRGYGDDWIEEDEIAYNTLKEEMEKRLAELATLFQ